MSQHYARKEWVSVKARGTGGARGTRGNGDQMLYNFLILKIKEKEACIHRKKFTSGVTFSYLQLLPAPAPVQLYNFYSV